MNGLPQLPDKERIRLYGPKFLRLTQKYSNEKLENYEGTEAIHSVQYKTQTPEMDLEGFFGNGDFGDYENDGEDDGETSRYFGGDKGRSRSAQNFSARSMS